MFVRRPRTPDGRRWLFGLAALLAILMAAVLLLAAVGSMIQSGVRAYVGGEGLWSKAQKDAVLHLGRYADTGRKSDWDGYLSELDVILGDSRARVELERPEADMTVVTNGFLAGRNAPEDVAAMAMVFRTFRHISYIDQAIAIWTAADGEIARLEGIGEGIGAAVPAGDRAKIAALTADLETANSRLTELENAFSQTLGEGARWLQGVLLVLTAAVVAALVIITAALGRFMVGRLRANDLAAAETLRASQARLRLLLDHLPAIVWTADDELTITSLTGEGLSRLAIAEPSLVGQPIQSLFEGEAQGLVSLVSLAAHRAALEGTTGGSYRTTLADRTFQVHLEPLTIEGRVIGVIGVALDLTDRLELETRLERSTRMESIGRLAGGVAHDFNNLLTAITGYSDLLVSSLPEGDQHHDAEEIRRAAKRAADLTGQLLAFGRRSVLKPEVISPNAVIDEMRNMVSRLTRDDIVTVFDLDPAVLLVLADPGQLEQVILNLAVNAADAMPDGGRLTITTRAVFPDGEGDGATPGSVDMSVSDTGVGMDEATRARVFEPFFTTKGHGNGTGLGLATAYGIVGQSGGSMRVMSNVGAGSTFTIRLPAATPVPAFPGAGPVRPVAEAAADPGRDGSRDREDGPAKPTILLAEDDAAVRSLVVHVLGDAGLTVVAAADGREALDLAADMPVIDLLLTDVMMPRLNGPDLAARLRNQRPNQRILFMSGFSDDGLGERGIIAPTVELLAKPFSPKELVDRVRQLLALPVEAEAGRSEVA